MIKGKYVCVTREDVYGIIARAHSQQTFTSHTHLTILANYWWLNKLRCVYWIQSIILT